LIRRGSAEGGIKGNVIRVITCRARTDITPMLAFCPGFRSPACMTAGQLIKGCIQFTRFEGLPNLYLLATFPPISTYIVEDILRLRLRLSLGRTFFCLVLKL